MNWYVKEFSKLTHVSVRTLHHYDEIGLLKPSLRSEGNYRLYSETDLLKLQCIVALKFFGFSLEQIKTLIKADTDVAQRLRAQERCLYEQMHRHQQPIKAIQGLAAAVEAGNPLEWSAIAKSIEVYDMTKNMTDAWMNKVYSPNQLEQFAQLKKRFTQEEQDSYERRWDDLIKRVKENITVDPVSPAGQALAKEWLALTDEIYGDFPELKDAIWLSYKHNKIPNAPFDKALWDFLEKAFRAMKTKSEK